MSADVEFDVRDDADDIASAISYSTDALDEANSVQVQNVSGVSVTVQEAEAIQDISGYDDSGSSFIIMTTQQQFYLLLLLYLIMETFMLM